MLCSLPRKNRSAYVLRAALPSSPKPPARAPRAAPVPRPVVEIPAAAAGLGGASEVPAALDPLPAVFGEDHLDLHVEDGHAVHPALGVDGVTFVLELDERDPLGPLRVVVPGEVDVDDGAELRGSLLHVLRVGVVAQLPHEQGGPVFPRLPLEAGLRRGAA